jgi:polar amino acid transport system substrate-binding protein/glutamate/aspartate transport system substrate-binding protein
MLPPDRNREHDRMRRLLPALLLLAGLSAWAPARAEDAIDRIARTGEVRLAVRADAPPFSSAGTNGLPEGYSIDLCQAVVAELAISLNRPITPRFVPVTGASRLDAIANAEADLLCEATTYTLSRRARMEFSLVTFVTGIVIAVRRDSPLALGQEIELPRRIGVLRGSTAEAALRLVLQQNPGRSTMVGFDSHESAIDAILSGAVEAYSADREIILAQMFQRGAGDLIAISSQSLSYEPYALAMPPGERRLALVADRALASLFRTGAIRDMLTKWFGERAWNDPTVRTVFRLQALPE